MSVKANIAEQSIAWRAEMNKVVLNNSHNIQPESTHTE
jgi:hypothetical protein